LSKLNKNSKHILFRYAIWQLAHGYESSQARVCGFMGYALQFKAILERFEQMDGLRVLYNYVSSRVFFNVKSI
jgi:hypothetical protein